MMGSSQVADAERTTDKYLAQLKTTAGSDHIYATALWSRTIRTHFGDDRRSRH